MTKSIAPYDPEIMRAQGVPSGWTQDEHGLLQHPRIGFRLLRVMLLDDGRVLYDQVLFAERGGGVFVPVDGQGRIGLQRMWRPQARDQERYAAAFPDVDPSQLGRVSYEVPRGFGERGETGKGAAVREAEEETRGRASEPEPLGPICNNTAFCPHSATAVWGRIDLAEAGPAEDAREAILAGLSFFSRRGLLELQREGQLYDGFTLAALALLWMQRPELLAEGD